MRVARLTLLLALVLALAACGGDDGEESAPPATTGEAPPTTTAATTEGGTTETEADCARVEAPEPREEGNLSLPSAGLNAETTYRLRVETNCGAFTIELDQETAPQTTASLVALTRAGFYDGTTFHRVVPGFVIQGGDPTGTGAGGPGYKTVDPPPADARYVQGVVAMAKAGFEEPGTSGSQFFVVTGADVGLPPEYALVGRVTDGLEAVLAIDALGQGDGPPSQPVVMERVVVEEE